MENNLACNKSYLRSAAWGLLLIVLLLGSFNAGLLVSSKTEVTKNLVNQEKSYIGQVSGKYSTDNKLSQDVGFGLYWDVWDMLKKEYVKNNQLNDKQLFYGSIKGMVASAGDPYTIFMDPKETKTFADDLSGTFEGIGAEIGIKQGNLVIIAPLPGTPAEKAGLRAGDHIIGINKQSTLGMSVDEAVNKIRGTHGTEVTLIVLSNNENKSREVKIIRDVIVVNSVKTELRKDKIFVLTITNFNNDTEELVNQAEVEINKIKPRAIILDLRNNPGGYLDTAVKVASKWISSGVIVSEKSINNKKDYPAEGKASFKDIPTVVLINQGSASASEIVAGALQDDKKATIMGMQSFGKGSVQQIETLGDGSSLKVTIAQWLTPKGNNINEKGITPDKKVDLTVKDYDSSKDPQMNAAVQFLTVTKK